MENLEPNVDCIKTFSKTHTASDLKHTDTQFSNSNFQITNQTLSTEIATVKTRKILYRESINNQIATTIEIPESFKVDASPFVERPFLVDTFEWKTTDAALSFLTSKVQLLPRDVINSNPSLQNAMKIASLYRSNLVLSISIAGTISHSGSIIAAIMPPLPFNSRLLEKEEAVTLINSMLSGPHAILNANEATSVVLEAPWYCNSDLATLDMEDNTQNPTFDIVPQNGNYATLVFLVLNSLQASDNSSQTLDVIVDATFKKLDIMVPCPRYITWSQGLMDGILDTVSNLTIGDAIDVASQITSWIGLHQPNDPTIVEKQLVTSRNHPNNVDQKQFYEVLDPHANFNRIYETPVFGTLQDEMDIKYILSKPQYIGTFSVDTSEPIGTVKWARPISPYQGGLGNAQVLIANNIEFLHHSARFWKGNLKLHIHSVMNNKQQMKFRVIKLYNPQYKIVDSYPNYDSVVNAPSDLLEFTAGGQIQTIELPYLCRNELTPCSLDSVFEALFHGIYYIYTAQRLASSDGSPQMAQFNIFMTAEDVEFFGYATEKLEYNGFKATVNSIVTSQSLEVMNEPQVQKLTETTETKRNPIPEEIYRIAPIMNIRDFLRRNYLIDSDEIIISPSNEVGITLPLSCIINEGPNLQLTKGVLSTMSMMYYGKTAGFKLQVVIDAIASKTDNLTVDIAMLPPNMYASKTALAFTGCTSDTIPLPEFNEANFPLPYSIVPTFKQPQMSRIMFEFKVPNLSPYKFIGSPEKYLDTAQRISLPYVLSTSDCGNILINIRNDNLEAFHGRIRIYASLTDESRLGFHCFAPKLTMGSSGNLLETLYLGGYATGDNQLPSSFRNPYIYIGSF